MSDLTDQVSTSIDALTLEFDIIAHNLANVSTVGFKRRCNAFSKSLEAQEAESYSPGTIDLNSVFDFTQGNIVETGRPLDFALHGKGFFAIETPEGPLYTRNGTFQTNQNGQIVDSLGRIVAGQAGPITIPNNVGISQLSVSNDGNISAGEIAIGKFRLVDFNDNDNKLVPTGDSCYRMPDENIQPVEAEQGSFERPDHRRTGRHDTGVQTLRSKYENPHRGIGNFQQSYECSHGLRSH